VQDQKRRKESGIDDTDEHGNVVTSLLNSPIDNAQVAAVVSRWTGCVVACSRARVHASRFISE
jgi:hypothetical protein